MAITFAGALWQALLRVFERRTLQLADGSLLLLDTKHLDALHSRGSKVLCCFHQRGNFLHH